MKNVSPATHSIRHQAALKAWGTRKKYRYLGPGDEAGREELEKLGYKFVRVTKKGSHMFALGNVTVHEEDEETIDAIETTFGLERNLQQALRENIQQLEHGLKIADGGKEKRMASGFIDLTAEDEHGTPVVIELKAGTADRETIGQILGYMGDLQRETKKTVRGIIVAGDFAPATVSALGALGNLQLRRYGFRFSFENISVENMKL